MSCLDYRADRAAETAGARTQRRAGPAHCRATGAISALPLRHIARGYLYKEVALRLGISSKTVEARVSAVLRKL